MQNSKSFFYYLFVLSLVGGGLVFLATSLYGAGVSADAVKNLSVAENLLTGHGFFDHTGGPFVFWPPLYPLLLAGLSWLTGLGVFVSGWYFNMVVMVMNVFLAGVLVYEALRERLLYAYLGALFVLVSESAVRIHSNVSSDPFYITFSLFFLLAANRYLAKKSIGSIWVMIACAALATLQRWLGASLVAMGGVVIFVARWKQWKLLVRDGSLMSLSLIPPGAWIYFHNIRLYHTFWGNDSPPLDPWMNFEYGLTKIMHWFLPYHPRLTVVLYNPLIVLGIVGFLLVLIARKQDWRNWWQALWCPDTFPVVFFFPLSLLGLALTIVTRDHLDPYSDRYYVGFLASVIVILFLTLDILVLPRLHMDLKRGRVVVAILFGIWLLVYPVFSMYKYLSASMANGEASNYNYYNNRSFNENPTIPIVQELAQKHPSAYIYSNYADGVWFYTRRSAPLMPRYNVVEDTLGEVREKFEGWPGDKPGYILWLLPNEFKHVVPPKMLSEFSDLELIFESKQGIVYSVQAR